MLKRSSWKTPPWGHAKQLKAKVVLSQHEQEPEGGRDEGLLWWGNVEEGRAVLGTKCGNGLFCKMGDKKGGEEQGMGLRSG